MRFEIFLEDLTDLFTDLADIKGQETTLHSLFGFRGYKQTKFKHFNF